MKIRRIKGQSLLLITMLLLPAKLFAQYADTSSNQYGLPYTKADSWTTGKKIGLSLLEGQAFNISLLHFDKYILKEDFAQVTFEDIKRNMKFGTGWDNDSVGINMIGHPAQGSVYHIINRLNGLSFWGSLPIVFFNSTVWELLCETEPPSPNDFFTTSWNGMIMGETLWRIGNFAFRKSARKGVDFHLKTGLGARAVTELSHSTGRPAGSPAAGAGASATIDIIYGDRLHLKSNAPLSFFDLHLTASLGTGQSPIGEFTLLSRLWGLELNPKKGEAVFGIFDHMSSFLSESWTKNRAPYRCAEAASVGPGIFYSHNRFTTGAFIAATIIGAATTDYYEVYDRDYNFGSGYSIKSINTFKASDIFSVGLNFRHYQLFTYWGDKPTDIEDRHYVNSMGDNGTTLTEILNLMTTISPFTHFGIDLSVFFIHRQSFYHIHPSVRASHLTAELGFKYLFSTNR